MTPADLDARVQKIVDAIRFGDAQTALNIKALCRDVAKDASRDHAEAVDNVIRAAGDMRRELADHMRKPN